MSDRLQLEYGATQYLPPDLRACWGARLIVNERGHVDLVPDRQSWVGDDDLLTMTQQWLNSGALRVILANVRSMLLEGTIRTRQAHPIWVYDDHRGICLGNSNGSAGYFYMVVWLFEALPEGYSSRSGAAFMTELSAAMEADSSELIPLNVHRNPG